MMLHNEDVVMVLEIVVSVPIWSEPGSFLSLQVPEFEYTVYWFTTKEAKELIEMHTTCPLSFSLVGQQICF